MGRRWCKASRRRLSGINSPGRRNAPHAIQEGAIRARRAQRTSCESPAGEADIFVCRPASDASPSEIFPELIPYTATGNPIRVPSDGHTTTAISASLPLATECWVLLIGLPVRSQISAWAWFGLSDQIGVCSTSLPIDLHWPAVTATTAIELDRLHCSAVLYFSQSTDVRKRRSNLSRTPLKAAEDGRFCSGTQKSFGLFGTWRKSLSLSGICSTGKAMEQSSDFFG